jgi:iron complex outermembrane receptor protein
MMKAFLFSICYLLINISFGQNADSLKADTTRFLDEITVQAYAYEKPLIDVPAAIGLVSKTDFERYNNASLLPSINTIAGVRMEERSPGSYRLSIRGSTLRSPFGIRNVKIYWNDLPFTDPGGNTYLNLIDVSALKAAEVIKGPGSSLYGAGTGGVLLLKSSTTTFNKDEMQASITGGSFGLLRTSIGVGSSSEKANTNFQYSHQQTDGYREQSAMRRDVLQAQGTFSVSQRRTISASFFYTNLSYQTPGGLTLSQYQQNRNQARPAGGPNLSAVEQKATIYNKTLYTGFSQEYTFNTHWSNRTGVYATLTQFENPTIRNYERRVEQSFGARSVSQYKKGILTFTFGGEYQYGFSPIKVYDNNRGNVGALQTDDEITSVTGLLFSQSEISLPKDFFLTVGVSVNFNRIKFTELSASPVVDDQRSFKPVVSPRIALLKKLSSSLSVYGSFSQGFSPPTVAELFPSAAVFNKKLRPEKGNNYEIGFHGVLGKVLSFDAAAYFFRMIDAITIRRTSDGGEYFVNAGSTIQRGIELNFSYSPKFTENSFVSTMKVWTSATLNKYSFDRYVKDVVDYSGNKLTGVSPHIINLGLDVSLRPQVYLNITSVYTDRIPLDDANTAFAESYVLLGCKLGYITPIRKLKLEVFVGADNLLDQQYSLGNDLNAQAGRFYNAAPARNFFVGLKTNLSRTRHQ